jgi:hypothetical protein
MSIIEMLKSVKKGDKVIAIQSDMDYEGILIKKGKYEVVIKYNYICGKFEEDTKTFSNEHIRSIIKMPDDHITKWKICKICNNRIKFRDYGSSTICGLCYHNGKIFED